MNRPIPPNAQGGPYIDAWPVADAPQYRGRVPSMVGPVMGNSGGVGGITVPPTSAGVFNLERYATINGSRSYPVGLVSAKLLDAPNTYRNFLHLRNASGVGGANLYVEFGNDAVLDAAGIAGSILRLAPNEQFLCDAVVPQDDIYAIADAAGGLLVIAQSVISLPT